MPGRAGGSISDVVRLGAGAGATDCCLEGARVDMKFGFGVDDAPR